MQRVTISVSDEFAAEVDSFMTSNGYNNRSEAVRDLARSGLARMSTEKPGSGPCIAALSYIFNHHRRELPKRLTEQAHNSHHLTVATMHVHLDRDNCLEVAVLKGDLAAVKEFAGKVVAERGVQHGNVHYVPLNIEPETHNHGDNAHAAHIHAHPRPKGQ